MANKVEIRKDQAEAIEDFLRHNSKQELIANHMQGQIFRGTWYPINTLSFDDLATALYVGYTIKKKPEELVREYYEDIKEDYMEATCHSTAEITAKAKMTAIKSTLNRLDIKIEGVNA